MNKFRFQKDYLDAYILVRGLKAIFEAVDRLNAEGKNATLENIQKNTYGSDKGTLMILLSHAERDGYFKTNSKAEKEYAITPEGRLVWNSIILAECTGF
jgi:hypothetical protein